MFVAGILSWWYGAGWRTRMSRATERLIRTYDYFSIDILARTLFAPFRQISAGSVSGSISVMFRAWVDRTISRFIGAFIRTFLIIFGCATIVMQMLFGVVELIVWAIIPLLPVVGAVLAVIGWIPSWMSLV